jgi:hypothetical protein
MLNAATRKQSPPHGRSQHLTSEYSAGYQAITSGRKVSEPDNDIRIFSVHQGRAGWRNTARSKEPIAW